MHRTTLLGQPRHFHHSSAFAIDMRRLGHNSANRHNTRATNTGDHHIPCAINYWQFGHR